VKRKANKPAHACAHVALFVDVSVVFYDTTLRSLGEVVQLDNMLSIE
jgi:hypothetical protein